MRALYLLMILGVVLVSGCTQAGTETQTGPPDMTSDDGSGLDDLENTSGENEENSLPLGPDGSDIGKHEVCGALKVNYSVARYKIDSLAEASKQAGFAFVGLLVNYVEIDQDEFMEDCLRLTDLGILCIPVQEHKDNGTLSVFGVFEPLPEDIDMAGMIDHAKNNSAFSFISRPTNNDNMTRWKRWDITSWDALAAMSPMTQRLNEDELAIQKWHVFLGNGLRRFAVGETDVKHFSSTYEIRNMIDSSYQCVLLNESFSRQSLTEALMKGRSYVTNSPHVEFTVNKQAIGSEINATYGEEVELYLKVESLTVFNRVMILRNGVVIQEIGKPLNRFTTNLTSTVVKDTWFTAEVWGTDSTTDYHDPVHALTNPIWVNVQGSA